MKCIINYNYNHDGDKHMSSISPVRVTGLSGNFDMEGIIEASMIRDKEKVNKAKQDQQIVKWKQEIYRDIIKESKNLYDKYLNGDSPNSITNKKHILLQE